MSGSGGATIYYESSWSILSTIGMVNVFLGGVVISITRLSGLSVLPVIVSVACAIANGLCYYAFYGNHAKKSSIVAAAIADIMWLVQEAGLSFYSYQILFYVLKDRAKKIFLAGFWFLMVVITGLRVAILVMRMKDISLGHNQQQKTINRLHQGYFISIAVCECLCSFFLIRSFTKVYRASRRVFSGGAMLSQLTRSAEIRVGTLCLIGIMRAVTYSFQTQSQSADDIGSQVDRFAYTLECIFPMVLMIDLLASRLAGKGTTHTSGNTHPTPPNRGAIVEYIDLESNNPNEQTRRSEPRRSFLQLNEPKTAVLRTMP